MEMPTLLAVVLVALSSLAKVHATVHHLLVGTYNASSIYTFELDDVAETLTLNATSNATAAHPWLSLDANRTHVYGPAWTTPNASYAAYVINSDYTVSLLNSVPNCNGSTPVVSTVLGSSFFYGLDFDSPCGVAYTLSSNGSFGDEISELTFSANSTMHGLASTTDEKFLYATDIGGDQVWAYSVDNSTGALSLIGTTRASAAGAGPRHSVVHPNGTWLYAVNEEGLTVDIYARNLTTGALTLMNLTVAATPFGLTPANASSYWADEVMLSADMQTLYVSTRAHTSGTPGFLGAYLVSDVGTIEHALTIIETPASGGTSGAVSPSPWLDDSRNIVAYTDSDVGFLAAYKLVNASVLEMIALVNVSGTGCCANAVWVD